MVFHRAFFPLFFRAPSNHHDDIRSLPPIRVEGNRGEEGERSFSGKVIRWKRRNPREGREGGESRVAAGSVELSRVRSQSEQRYQQGGRKYWYLAKTILDPCLSFSFSAPPCHRRHPPPCILSPLSSFASGSGETSPVVRDSYSNRRAKLLPSMDSHSFSLSLWRRIRLESSHQRTKKIYFSSGRCLLDRANCFRPVLKGNRLRYSSGHCGIERGLENNERRGCQRSTDIFFRPIDSQSASVPPFPASIFARSVELALIFTSCDCKNGEPFGERCMLKICRVAITG